MSPRPSHELTTVRKAYQCNSSYIRVYLMNMHGTGFEHDAVVMAESSHNMINLTLCENGWERYKDLVKFARKNNFRIFQVRQNGIRHFIEVDHVCICNAKLTIGDTLDVSYSYGKIQLTKTLQSNHGNVPIQFQKPLS